jgi:hypothetical protein
MNIPAHIVALADKYIADQNKRLGKIKAPIIRRNTVKAGRARANKAIAKYLGR